MQSSGVATLESLARLSYLDYRRYGIDESDEKVIRAALMTMAPATMMNSSLGGFSNFSRGSSGTTGGRKMIKIQSGGYNGMHRVVFKFSKEANEFVGRKKLYPLLLSVQILYVKGRN